MAEGLNGFRLPDLLLRSMKPVSTSSVNAGKERLAEISI